MSLKQVLHVIDGQETPSLSGRTFESINPATGQAWATVAHGETDDVNRAVESAWRSFDSGVWSRMPATEQAKRMRAVSRLIIERADYLAELETKDTGKPLTAAKSDVLLAAGIFEYFSQIPDHVFGKTYP